MNAFGFGIRSLFRDLRGGELTVLLSAVVLAVAAMTAVGFFTDRVAQAIRAQAGSVLAGDLELRSASPIDPRYIDDARRAGLQVAGVVAFPTMALTDEANALVYVRAVTGNYPLRGELLIADRPFGRKYAARGIPEPGTAWAEPGLLGRMNIDVGTVLSVGSTHLRISRVLEYQPGQTMGGMAALAPGLLINQADLQRLDVIRPGSRVTYRQLFAGSSVAIEQFRSSLKNRLDDGVRMRGLEDAGAQINAAIDRARRFLTLASLVTVILAAVATAMATRRYALRHLDNVALLKSLGATQGFIQRSTLTQLAMVVLATAAIGSVIGYAAQEALAVLSRGLLKVQLPPANWTAATLGLLTAATITIGFAMPRLLQLKTTPPMRVLRHDLPPPQLSASLSYGVAVGALLLLTWAIVRNLPLVLLIAGGLAGVAAVGMLAGWALVWMFTRFRGAAGVAWRYGLANISRRGSESVVQIVAFALSLMVLLLLTLVRADLMAGWRASLPEDAPNYFLINIEPETWPSIETFFAREVGQTPDFLPFIRGRITRINGKPVDEMQFSDPRSANFVRQETNLTWGEKLPDSNELLAGQWWDEKPDDSVEVSLESDIAQGLGLSLGDTLSFNVGGEEFTAPVTSLRRIEWDSMRPNFYVMLSPGLARQLPQTYVASVFVPPEHRAVLNEFVRGYPGVTVLDLGAILTQLRMVIDRASMAVQYVFLFTLLAGVMVLLAAIQSTRDERRFESAVLHTLGASRRTILQGVAVEFSALGLLAGLLAALGASLVAWLLATRVFELDYSQDPLLWLAGVVAGGAIVGVTGTLAARGAVTEPPVAVLRES